MACKSICLVFLCLVVAALALPAPARDPLEQKENAKDLKTDESYGFGYAYPYLGYSYGYRYPSYGYGYGIGYPSYYGSYGYYPYYF